MVTDEQVKAAYEAGFIKNDSISPMKAMRAALEAAEDAAWKPIEEAPKDKILLVKGGPVIWMGGGWFSFVLGCHVKWEPTHFRHLPEPPK